MLAGSDFSLLICARGERTAEQNRPATPCRRQKFRGKLPQPLCGRKLMAVSDSERQKAFTIAATALALICIGAWFGSAAKGAEKNDVPNFAASPVTAWVPSRAAGDNFLPPPAGPGPVVDDPAHPY